MDQPASAENKSESLLTSIHEAYTLSNTNEAEGIMIKTFLETLAEVALRIAARKSNDSQKEFTL